MGENFSSGTTPLAVNPTRVIEVKILNALNGGGGGGGGGTAQVFAASYAGGQPNFTPTTSTAIAFDTSNGTEWAFYGNAWH